MLRGLAEDHGDVGSAESETRCLSRRVDPLSQQTTLSMYLGNYESLGKRVRERPYEGDRSPCLFDPGSHPLKSLVVTRESCQQQEDFRMYLDLTHQIFPRNFLDRTFPVAGICPNGQ